MQLLPKGPLYACPQCGATVMRCTPCTVSGRTEPMARGTAVRRTLHSGNERVPELHAPTSLSRLCSPQRRVRMGFLWHKQYQRHDLHVHQKCERCGWGAPAYIMRSESGR